MNNTPQSTAGIVRTIGEGQPALIEVRGKQQETIAIARSRPIRKPEIVSSSGRDLTSELNADAARRHAGVCNRPIEFRHCFAQRDAVQVCGKTDDALSVIALDQTRHRSRFQFRNVCQLGFLPPALHDRADLPTASML
jgi:hypothetical protein